MCAILCPDHFKSERKFSRFYWSQPKMHSGIILTRVNSCVLKHLFLQGVQKPKKSPTRPGNVSLRRATSHVFKIPRHVPQIKKPRSVRFFEFALCAVLMNSFTNNLITNWLGAKKFWEVVYQLVRLHMNDFDEMLENWTPMRIWVRSKNTKPRAYLDKTKRMNQILTIWGPGPNLRLPHPQVYYIKSQHTRVITNHCEFPWVCAA